MDDDQINLYALTPNVVSYSELDTFRQCPFKWKLAYGERWVGPTSGTSALDKGSLWHLVLEAYYRALMGTQGDARLSAEARRDNAMAEGAQIIAAAYEKYPPEIVDLIAWMFVGYVERYGVDPEWTIVAVEHTAIVELAPDVHLKVKIDLLVTDERGRMWIIDHKSASRIPRDSADYAFDDQFGLYTLAMRKLGYKVVGAIHNAATTNRNKGDIIAPGSPEWKASMKAQTLEARMHRTYMNRTALELEGIGRDAVADTRLMYSSANEGQRRPNTDTCKWRCSFTEACLLGRRQGNDNKTRDMLADTGWSQDHTRH